MPNSGDIDIVVDPIAIIHRAALFCGRRELPPSIVHNIPPIDMNQTNTDRSTWITKAARKRSPHPAAASMDMVLSNTRSIAVIPGITKDASAK